MGIESFLEVKMTNEEIILKEWNDFIKRTPKDIGWYEEFEKFIQTEPYKTAFEAFCKGLKINRKD